MGAPVLTRRGRTRSEIRPDHQHDTGDDRETVTVDAALTLYEAETKRTGCTVHRGRVLALRAALCTMKLAELTRDHLDRLCDEWQAIGVRYAERDVKLHRVRPITGATCNSFMAILHLRHSCLTNLAEAGVPDSTARAISGHKTDSAHHRYVITQPAAKKAAMTEAVESAKG